MTDYGLLIQIADTDCRLQIQIENGRYRVSDTVQSGAKCRFQIQISRGVRAQIKFLEILRFGTLRVMQSESAI